MMKLPARKRAGIVVAGVLGVDCVMHMFWASTGSSWPATTDKGLSRGLLNGDFSFTPGVLFPLAAILLVATLMVLIRAGLLRRFAAVPTWLPQLVTIGTGAAVLVRAIAGVVWIASIDASTTTPFYWLNLAFYTPACLVMFAACFVLLRSPDHRVAVSAEEPRLPAGVRAARHR
jgi:hypothetical protein